MDPQSKLYPYYIKAILYFERIIEQTVHDKYFYNYGVITNETKGEWSEIQKNYLVPLLKNQINRNKWRISKEIKNEKVKKNDNVYMNELFEYFCDDKTDYIDLSCIKQEIENMCEELREILFTDSTKCLINNDNLKQIFPYLMQYKNTDGHWISLK